MKKLTKIQQKFLPLIGCPTYIDKKGYLIIDSKAKVVKLDHINTGVGMFVGLNPFKKGYELLVSYGGGGVVSIYQPKFSKIV